MGTKKRYALILTVVAATGFLLLWTLEGFLESLIREPGSLKGYLASFVLEKIQRFGIDAAAGLLPQIKFRWLLLCIFGWWLTSSPDNSRQVNEESLRWRVRLFFVVQLLYLPDLLGELNIRWRWAGFFEPTLLPGIFLEKMPSLVLMQFCGLFLFGISAWLILTNWKNGSLPPLVFALVVWLLWTFLLSVYQSAGITDHAYASMHSAMFFMVIFLFIWWREPASAGFGHQIFQAGIWACYFFAGLEKVFLSGPSWLKSDNFALLCRHYPGKFCEWFASHPYPAGVCLSAVLIFQIMSPLQWQFPRWAYVTLTFGIIFHLGTWLVLNVGGWQSPWMSMLIFLLPPGKNKNDIKLSA